MDTIVDLSARRNKAADQPDPEFVSRDFRTFIGRYEFDGAQWGVEIWARDHAEAERKMAAISSGKIDGQLMSIVPA